MSGGGSGTIRESVCVCVCVRGERRGEERRGEREREREREREKASCQGVDIIWDDAKFAVGNEGNIVKTCKLITSVPNKQVIVTDNVS